MEDCVAIISQQPKLASQEDITDDVICAVPKSSAFDGMFPSSYDRSKFFYVIPPYELLTMNIHIGIIKHCDTRLYISKFRDMICK